MSKGSLFRIVPQVIDEGEESSGLVRRPFDSETAEFFAVQEKEGSRWYTVDDFSSLIDAEEFLRQLLCDAEEE